MLGVDSGSDIPGGLRGLHQASIRVATSTPERLSHVLRIIAAAVGPRFVIVMWWLIDFVRWEHAFDTWIIPLLGFLFLPWTTLMFIIVAPSGNVNGWDWIWLGFALLTDIASYGSNGYTNRQRVPGYAP